MNTKSIPTIWLAQIGIAICLGAILAIGNQSQPRLRTKLVLPPVDQPLVLEFDRTIAPPLGEVITLSDQSGALVGVRTVWSGKRAILTPEQPLKYGTSYELTIANIADTKGEVLRSPIHRVFSTAAARFLYVSAERQLVRYEVASKKSTVLSLARDNVTGYVTSPDGAWVTYLTNSRIVSFSLGQKPSQYTISTFPERTVYERPLLCNQVSELVLSESTLDEKGHIAAQRLVRAPLQNKAIELKKAVTLLSDQEIPDFTTVQCDPYSTRLVYRDPSGSVVVGSLYDVDGQVVGSFSNVYSLSPQTSSVVVGDVDQSTFPITRGVYVLKNATRTRITEIGMDAADPVFFPDESVVAVTEEAIAFREDGVPTSDPQVVLYRLFPEGTVRDPLPIDESGMQDQKPVWARDGRTLTFERVVSARSAVGERNRALDGSFTDGTIWQVAPNCLDSSAAVCLPGSLKPESTGVNGSQVSWLP